MTGKVQILVELIARLRVARLDDESIAKRVGLSRGGLSRILALPEYKAAQDQALKDVTNHMDSLIKARSDFLAQEWARDAVPEAMQSLVAVVRQKRDLRACLTAAKEILDRDPNRTLPVQSPSGAATGPAHATIDMQRLPDHIFGKLSEQVNQIAAVQPAAEEASSA